MRRARKALGRLRKSLNATKRSLWKDPLDAARAKGPRALGRLRKSSKNATKHALSGGNTLYHCVLLLLVGRVNVSLFILDLAGPARPARCDLPLHVSV